MAKNSRTMNKNELIRSGVGEFGAIKFGTSDLGQLDWKLRVKTQ